MCIQGARPLAPGVWSTGAMGQVLKEQAMVLDLVGGGVVVTGCAHPGVLRVVERAGMLLSARVELLLGGFHLASLSPLQVRAVARRLRELRVRRVAPAHCTGQVAREELREAFGDEFVEVGVGLTLEL